MHISHEAIYRAIYLRKSHTVLPKGIYHCLRCCRPIRYGKYYFTRGQWRSQIKNAQSIDQCPTEANNRLIPGHWEGDLVLGTNFSQVATLVDRCTKEVQLPRYYLPSWHHLRQGGTNTQSRNQHYLSMRGSRKQQEYPVELGVH